jgi:hypothetical protein
MAPTANSEGWNDLVEELKELEAFFPLLGVAGEREELQEEVHELEELISAAGIPDDEHSREALRYLHTELSRKRTYLNNLSGI